MASLFWNLVPLLVLITNNNLLGSADAKLQVACAACPSATLPTRSTSLDSEPLCNTISSTSPIAGLPNCSLSFNEIASGRQEAGNILHPSPFPSWINVTLAQIGQQFAIKNRLSITIGALTGLLSGLPFPDARDVLSFTGMSDTNSAAIKRYLATATQLFLWFDELLETDLVNGNGVFLQSIANVRVLHIEAAAKANERAKAGGPLNDAGKYANVTLDDEMWAAIAQDLETSDLVYRDYNSSYTMYDSSQVYINQFIQGVTLTGFMGYTVLDPESVLIWDVTDDELKGFLHLWAIIGYAVGLQDEYNLCLQPDVASARALVADIHDKLAIPAFFKIDTVGKVMIEALIEGVNNYIPGFGGRVTMYRVIRDHFKIPVTNLQAILSPEDIAAQSLYDNYFVPMTKDPAARIHLNHALMATINALVVGNFGAVVTDEQKSRYAFYPSCTR